MFRRELKIGSATLSIETGKLAKQSDGAVIIRQGDTMVLVTACRSASAREGIDFLPLTVDYRESAYASGRIPGGFFKREGKPADKETLTCRLIDRPIRPLFPAGWYYETQIIGMLILADAENDSDVLAITGASAALAISTIPFEQTIAAVRVGLLDGQFIVNPTYPQRKTSKIDLVVAGSKTAIMMVESGAEEATEDEMITALETAHAAIKQIVDMIDDLKKEVGKPKTAVAKKTIDAVLRKTVEDKAYGPWPRRCASARSSTTTRAWMRCWPRSSPACPRKSSRTARPCSAPSRSESFARRSSNAGSGSTVAASTRFGQSGLKLASSHVRTAHACSRAAKRGPRHRHTRHGRRRAED